MSTELNHARVQPEIEPIWQWYDWARDLLTVQLSNGMDVEVSVARDIAQGRAFYDVETADERQPARQWVALNETLCCDLWEQERRRP